MTRRRKAWIGIAAAILAGPVAALSLLITVPLTDAQADRVYGLLARKCAGEDVWLPGFIRLPKVNSMMRRAKTVYVFTSTPDAARHWHLDPRRTRILPRESEHGLERRRNSCVLYASAGKWIKGDRVYVSGLDYGSSYTSRYFLRVFVQRSWLGTWVIAHATYSGW